MKSFISGYTSPEEIKAGSAGIKVVKVPFKGVGGSLPAAAVDSPS